MIASNADCNKSKSSARIFKYHTIYFRRPWSKILLSRYRSTLAIWQDLEWPIILFTVCIVFSFQIWSVNFEIKRRNSIYLSVIWDVSLEEKKNSMCEKQTWQTWTQIKLVWPTDNLHFSIFLLHLCNEYHLSWNKNIFSYQF